MEKPFHEYNKMLSFSNINLFFMANVSVHLASSVPLQDLYLEKKHISDAEDAYLESESSGSLSSSSMVHDQSSQTIEKDLVMVGCLFLSSLFSIHLVWGKLVLIT